MGEGKQAPRLRRSSRGHILNLKKILGKKNSREPGLRIFFLFFFSFCSIVRPLGSARTEIPLQVFPWSVGRLRPPSAASSFPLALIV